MPPLDLIDNGTKPFFQQGTPSEQNLVQDLINEQIRMYGVKFCLHAKNFVNVKTIMRGL